MNKKENINKMIDEAINSIDHTKRAAPKPFLLTRINARLSKAGESVWEKAVSFVVRPSIAIPGLVMVILVNVLVIAFNRHDPYSAVTEQSNRSQNDELSFTVTAFYDIENTEP